MGKFGNDEAQRKSQGFRWPDRPIMRHTPVTLKFSTTHVRIEQQSWLIGSFCILPPSLLRIPSEATSLDSSTIRQH